MNHLTQIQKAFAEAVARGQIEIPPYQKPVLELARALPDSAFELEAKEALE